MKKRRSRTAAQILLCTFALLIVSAWVFRIPLFESLLHSRLSARGFHVLNLEVESVNPRRATIQNIQFPGGTRLRQLDAELDWKTPSSAFLRPELSKIALTGLKLEFNTTAEGLKWQELMQIPKINTLPEVEIRDASAKIFSPDNSILAEIIAPLVSLVPTHVQTGSGDKRNYQQTFDAKTEIIVKHLRVESNEFTDGVLNTNGMIELRYGRMYYKPADCDQFSLNAVKNENMSVSGPLSYCITAGGSDFAVALDSDSSITLDMVIKPEPARVDLKVAGLPPVPVELERGSLSVQLSHGSDGLLVENLALQEINVLLPAAGVLLEGIEISSVKQPASTTGTEATQGLSLELGAQSIRHLAAIPSFQPLAMAGNGSWAQKALTVDITYKQTDSGLGPGLDGTLHFHRDNENGEGEIEFDISPLEFREGSLNIDDVSPAIAQFFARVTGEVNANGKILFNDAWATPLQIAGLAEKLVLETKPSLTSANKEDLAVDFGKSEFKISLPPLALEKGWATLNITDGGLRIGETELEELTGSVQLLSLWPLTCPRRDELATVTNRNSDGVAGTIVSCLYDAFQHEQYSSAQTFHGAMNKLDDYLSRQQ